MLITNANQARIWMSAWGWAPRAGLLKATIAGLAMSRALAASAGHKEEAQSYTDAIAVISNEVKS